MAFVPQLCAVEKKQALSTYATKSELLDYSMKGALNTHTNTMESYMNTKLLRFTRKEALNTYTNSVGNYVDTKLLDYATERKWNNELQSYAKKTDEGDIDVQNHQVINVSHPASDSHAVSLNYLNKHKCQPIICITAEAVGPIHANTTSFSFEAKESQPAVLNNGGSGVVIPTDGRIVYMTACSLNANGASASREVVSFGFIGDGFMGIETALYVSIPGGAIKGSKTITVEHTRLGGAVLNFSSLDNSQCTRIAIVSAFAELDF